MFYAILSSPFFHWIMKSFSVYREGFTVLKSILSCWWKEWEIHPFWCQRDPKYFLWEISRENIEGSLENHIIIRVLFLTLCFSDFFSLFFKWKYVLPWIGQLAFVKIVRSIPLFLADKNIISPSILCDTAATLSFNILTEFFQINVTKKKMQS